MGFDVNIGKTTLRITGLIHHSGNQNNIFIDVLSTETFEYNCDT